MAKEAKATGKDKKKAKGKKGASAKDAPGGISVATHPRAAASVRRAKGLGGLAAFALAAYLSHGAGVPLEQVALRALAFGVAGYLVAWACAVAVWRHLVLAELRHAIETGRATYAPPAGEQSGRRRGRGRRAAQQQPEAPEAAGESAGG
ncbi:MAG TPA: hypothetical protein VKV27_09415 [Solirubrobacteraceae bacterium]|nr:hypothetical protein [Solirubrobacteraceae bacterium]